MIVILTVLTSDKARVTNTSPDNSDPLKFVDVNSTIEISDNTKI